MKITIKSCVHWYYFPNMKIRYQKFLFNNKYNATEQLKTTIQKFNDIKWAKFIENNGIEIG